MIRGLLRALESEEETTRIRAWGQKSALLARAAALGFAVPPGLALTADEVQRLVAGEGASRDALQCALAQLVAEGAERLAVRASPVESLPGALLTELAVEPRLAPVLSALAAVSASTAADSARAQRRARGLTQEAPALPVLIQRQVMVARPEEFGAVAFTRDPERGSPGILGEYRPGGGVEQVVSGAQVPAPLTSLPRASQLAREACLASRDPAAFTELEELAQRLEHAFDEPLELELVRAEGRLWLVQVRPLVMSARALVNVALEAIERDSPKFRTFAERLLEADFTGLIERAFPAPAPGEEPLLRGLSASPGAASGIVVTDAARAVERAARGEPVILFRNHATPEDVAAFRAAAAVVTTSGGLTCHAAVIARGLAVPAVVGCAEARVDARAGVVQLRQDPSQVVLREGEQVSVDAHRGLVRRGPCEALPHVVSEEFKRLAQELRKLRPLALWGYGPPEAALRAKEEACLDGVVCPVRDLEGVPPARGRECWLELSAERAAELLPHVPAGWGVVLRGEVSEARLAELRGLARLRPFGVHLPEAFAETHAAQPKMAGAGIERSTPRGSASARAEGFELAVVPPNVGALTPLSGLAPRLLLRLDSAQDAALLGQLAVGGVLCETGRSFEWMLRLALRPRAPTSAH